MWSLTLYFLGSVVGAFLVAGLNLLFGFHPILSVGWDMLITIPTGMVGGILIYALCRRLGLVSEPVLK